MMTRKRLAMESVLFAAAIYIGYFAFMMLQGMVLTKRHAQDLDLAKQYERMETLQPQVTFGMMERSSGWQTAAAIGGFVLLGGLYGYIRWQWTKRRSQS
ncbi:hypothetical protein [Paenibacillus sp. BR1-192]|uniref:hypothetical protein n=1 Tax=Paenibacillus sp. BR1-192 TaxID=3032287 RepID=UPI00240D704D|nr:hypothetical protein [Paenibacillus sp. BR1-192]WFB56656.1 hypothetical protein P0X86_21985 [Paenibacillus sp. BR1-192]